MQGSFEIVVTLKGSSLQDVIAQAKALVDADENHNAVHGTTNVAPRKRGRPAAIAAPVEVVDEDLIDSDDEPTEAVADEDDGVGFDVEDDEAMEEIADEPAPKKSAAPKKLTDKDVNTAAMKHAKAHGRPKTLAILKKQFKVQSVLELKPEMYAKAISALKVN